MKKNSIDLFIYLLKNRGYLSDVDVAEAKAMHKEETIKLYYAYEDYVLREEGIIKTFGQFYNETFGGNNEQQ